MPDKDTDFFDIWRSMIQEWESQTNAALGKVTEQEAFGRVVGQATNASLKLQSAFNSAVERSLTGMNLPSRGELLRLGDKLDAIERKLDALLEGRAAAAPKAPASPPARKRTRRPPQESRP